MSSELVFSVAAVKINMDTGWPVILLSNYSSQKTVAISLNKAAAMATLYALNPGVYPFHDSRPTWIDLFMSVVHVTGSTVKNVSIDKITSEGIYTAKIRLSCSNGNECIELDALPSDAIPVALKSLAPIQIAKEVYSRMPLVSYESPPFREISLEDIFKP